MSDIRDVKLNEDQLEMVEKLHEFVRSDRKFFRADGAAGTGKSTTVAVWAKEIVDMGYEIALAAPTNKATKNLRSFARKISTTVTIRCGTIFSLLGLVMKPSGEVRELHRSDTDRLGGVDIVVVDEWSMVNDMLMDFIRAHVNSNPGVKFVFMGDPYQLPPVGQLESAVCQLPVDAFLTKVERHDNQILSLATYLRECIESNSTPRFTGDHDDEGGVYVLRSADYYKQIRKAFSSSAYLEDGEAFKAISWRNVMVDDANETIREAMYGASPKVPFELGERIVAKGPVMDVPEFAAGGLETFCMTTDEEARVMAITIKPHPVFYDIECYDVLLELEQGDPATAYMPTKNGKRAYQRMEIELAAAAKKRSSEWTAFWQFKACFADLAPCHALTVHRSQGSTYRTAFVDAADIMSNRTKPEMLRMLYTAATRPSKALIIKV